MRIEKFEAMWNATTLSIVPFNEVWAIDKKDDMVRPRFDAMAHLKLRLSFTENVLYSFFLGIYNRQMGMMDVLLYWHPVTPEGRVILKWLDDRFFF